MLALNPIKRLPEELNTAETRVSDYLIHTSRSVTPRRPPATRRGSPATVRVAPAARVYPAAQPAANSSPISSTAVVEAIELARTMLSGNEVVYAFRVQGQALSDALVNDGDVVILAKTSEINNGDLTAVCVMGQDGRKTTSLKHFYRENGHVRLQPVHPDMAPWFYQPEHVVVQGRVMLIIRQAG